MTASPAQTARTWPTPPGLADASDSLRTFVTFDLGNQTLAADVTEVREILDLQEISSLPNASAGLSGMIDLRGEGIAVIDLALSLGLSRQEADRDSRIIVLGGRSVWWTCARPWARPAAARCPDPSTSIEAGGRIAQDRLSPGHICRPCRAADRSDQRRARDRGDPEKGGRHPRGPRQHPVPVLSPVKKVGRTGVRDL